MDPVAIPGALRSPQAEDEVSVLTPPVVTVSRRPSREGPRQPSREAEARDDAVAAAPDQTSVATPGAATVPVPDQASVATDNSRPFEIQRKGTLDVIKTYHGQPLPHVRADRRSYDSGRAVTVAGDALVAPAQRWDARARPAPASPIDDPAGADALAELFFEDQRSVASTYSHVRDARAPGAGRAVTPADLAALAGDYAHLDLVPGPAAFSPPRSAVPRRVLVRRRSPPAKRRAALPEPLASPPPRRTPPRKAYVRPVPTPDGVRQLLETFPDQWTAIREHTTWGSPEPTRKDAGLRRDPHPGVHPATYRTHHLRRPGALKPFDAQTGAARALAS